MGLSSAEMAKLGEKLHGTEGSVLRRCIKTLIGTAGKGNLSKVKELLNAFAALPTDASKDGLEALLQGIPKGRFQEALEQLFHYSSGSGAAIDDYKVTLSSTKSTESYDIETAFQDSGVRSKIGPALREATVSFLKATVEEFASEGDDTQKKPDGGESGLIDRCLMNLRKLSVSCEQAEQASPASAAAITVFAGGAATLSRAGGSIDDLMKVLLIGGTDSHKSRFRTTLSSAPSGPGGASIDFTVVKTDRTKYQVWDMAGQERFQTQTISSAYYRGAQIVFCFAVDENEVRLFKNQLDTSLETQKGAQAYFVAVGAAPFLNAELVAPYGMLTLPENYDSVAIVDLLDHARSQILLAAAEKAAAEEAAAKEAEETAAEEAAADDVPTITTTTSAPF